MKLAELIRLNGIVARLTRLRNKQKLSKEDRVEVLAIGREIDPGLWEEIWIKPFFSGGAA